MDDEDLNAPEGEAAEVVEKKVEQQIKQAKQERRKPPAPQPYSAPVPTAPTPLLPEGNFLVKNWLGIIAVFLFAGMVLAYSSYASANSEKENLKGQLNDTILRYNSAVSAFGNASSELQSCSSEKLSCEGSVSSCISQKTAVETQKGDLQGVLNGCLSDKVSLTVNASTTQGMLALAQLNFSKEMEIQALRNELLLAQYKNGTLETQLNESFANYSFLTLNSARKICPAELGINCTGGGNLTFFFTAESNMVKCSTSPTSGWRNTTCNG